MTKPSLLSNAIVLATAAAVYLFPGLAMADPLTDLHDVVVGMPAQQLPTAGYRDFKCAERPISTWTDWALCPADGRDGLHLMHVSYDQPGDDTKVGGHPVNLTVLFNASGRLTRIEIRTDDHAPLYLHKKAYMLGGQAKMHYGENHWVCKSVPASEGEEPIGSTYINEACTQVTAERRVEVSDRLFHKKGGAPRDFVSDATVSITAVQADSR